MLQYLIGSSPGTVTKDKIFAEHWNTKIQSPLKVATVIQSVAKIERILRARHLTKENMAKQVIIWNNNNRTIPRKGRESHIPHHKGKRTDFKLDYFPANLC